MKIVVIGGSGLIGSGVVSRLRDQGHDVLPASPSSGVNTLTGEGLADALAGADVVVDLANSPSFEDNAVMEFFRTAGEHLLPAEAAAGVKHHVALSIVGVDRNPDSGYMRAKLAQEELIRKGSVPYTIVRATQFMEFIHAIAQSSADGDTIRLTSAPMQPIAAADVIEAVADVALAAPVNGVVEIAGPQPLPLDDLGRRVLAANGDNRTVVTDPEARYFGSRLDDRSLTPDDGAHLGKIHFADWLSRSTAAASRPAG